MTKSKFRRIGKPTCIKEGPDGNWVFQLQPVETDSGFEIEWGAVYMSHALVIWRKYWGNYKRRNKRSYCLTAVEARNVIKSFSKALHDKPKA